MAPSTLTELAGKETLQASFVRDEDERPKVKRGRRYARKSSRLVKIGVIFQVVDHGVDTKLISEMTRLAREFFALPAEDKLRFDMFGGKKGGFIVSSHLQGETVQDWREIVTYFSYPN
ncbi:gibberellin 3-hydroxylase 2 [Gossypium australe]|uniref:Gibberellin 3-hydroxylase 2 n=1 Tax=Gossypium australe TaxID=47621 RepID=A0A5B6W063_9ROSI|nr:gibberellin 3-hydroxylase 2 [Gossypium australe]